MKALLIIALSLFISIDTVYAEISESTVEDIVKNSPCLDGLTIEDALKDKIKIRSQRDLGWHVFNEEGRLEVERAFLINKSMQIRFRWRADADGRISPANNRAESLCSK